MIAVDGGVVFGMDMSLSCPRVCLFVCVGGRWCVFVDLFASS